MTAVTRLARLTIAEASHINIQIPDATKPDSRWSCMIGKYIYRNRWRSHGWPRSGAQFLVLTLFFFFMASPVCAMMFHIPQVKGQPGREIRVPLVIDQTDNLAGVRLVLRYDKEILTFKEGTRSRQTQSFMHVINDKIPGRLIIVMASAKGIAGKEITLLTLTFTIKEGLKENRTTVIDAPTEVSKTGAQQCMSDDPKEIECRIMPGTIEIIAAKKEEKKGKIESNIKTDKSVIPRK